MIERKYLAHFINAAPRAVNPLWVRLGGDLEEYNEELNPQVEVKKNIIGEQRTKHNGYEVQSSVEPYYADQGDQLYELIENIALERLTGDDCKTQKVDVLVTESGDIVWAWQEDVIIVPTSLGGDTSGYQIPFTLYNNGNRQKLTTFSFPGVSDMYVKDTTLSGTGFKSGVTYYTRTGTGSNLTYTKVEGTYTTGTDYYVRKKVI